MNINFDRNRAQEACEYFTNSINGWNFEQNFGSLSINNSQSIILSQCLQDDALDFYYKGLLSLFEACTNIVNKRTSWASVKLYYSTFYNLRASLASKGIAIIRNGDLYYIKDKLGSTPIKKKGKKYNTTHEGVINIYTDLYQTDDILLSNKINNTNSYIWLKELREIINYKDQIFHEPNCLDIFGYAFNYTADSFNLLIKSYIEDNYILTFQAEHAWLCLPIKRAILTKKVLLDCGIKIEFTDEQISCLLDYIADSKLSDLLTIESLIKS